MVNLEIKEFRTGYAIFKGKERISAEVPNISSAEIVKRVLSKYKQGGK